MRAEAAHVLRFIAVFLDWMFFFLFFGLVLVFGAADLFGCASSCPPGVRIQQKAFLSSHLI